MEILQVAADFSTAYKRMNWAYHRMSREDLRARVEFKSVFSNLMPLVTNRRMREDDMFLLYEDLKNYKYGTLHVLHPGNLYMEPVTVTKEHVENPQGDYTLYGQDGDEKMYILSAGYPLIKLFLYKESRFIPYEDVERIFPSMFGWGRDVSYHLKKFTDAAENVTNRFLDQVRINPNLFIRFRIEDPSGVHRNDSYLLSEFNIYLQLLNKKNVRLRTLNDKLFKSNLKIVSIQNIYEIQYQQSFDAMWCFLYDKRVKAYVVCLLTSKDENNQNLAPIPSQNVVQVWKQTPNTDNPPERVEFLKSPYGYARIRDPNDYDVSNAQKSYIYKIDIDNLHVLSTLVRNDDDENLIENKEKIQRLFADLRPFTNFDFIRQLTDLDTDGLDDIDRATFLPNSNVVYTICRKFKALYDLLGKQDVPFNLHEFETRMKNYAGEGITEGYATAYTRRCIDFVTPTAEKIANLKQSKNAFIMVKNGVGEFAEWTMICAKSDKVLSNSTFGKIKVFYEQIKKIHLQETGFGFVQAKTRNVFRAIKSAIPFFEDSYPDPVIYMINQTRRGVSAPSPTANNNLLIVAMLLQVQVWAEEFGEFG